MWLRLPSISVLLVMATLLASGCASDNEPETTEDDRAASSAIENNAPDAGGLQAQAEIGPLGDSGLTGTITFVQSNVGLQISYTLVGLPQGEHGFHIHENGSCADGEDGTPGGAAGGHFNPGGAPHGGPKLRVAERHAGDFGNILSASQDTVVGSLTDAIALLDGPDSIVGKAVIIHANADDLTSQPSGEAGARIGCGIIRQTVAL